MEPWYKVATPRKEVREGRSFNPDEFAIALEQVVAGTAPEDYGTRQFFARTCFTRALREHAGMVLRRLSGKTENTAPVLTLITQFGGGKTHTLTALYHLARRRGRGRLPGCRRLVREAGLAPCRRRRSRCSSATPGTRSRAARRLGSTSPGNSRATRASRRWAGREDDAARHRDARAGVPGGGRAGAAAVRRGAELPEPPSRPARNRSTPSSRT